MERGRETERALPLVAALRANDLTAVRRLVAQSPAAVNAKVCARTRARGVLCVTVYGCEHVCRAAPAARRSTSRSRCDGAPPTQSFPVVLPVLLRSSETGPSCVEQV